MSSSTSTVATICWPRLRVSRGPGGVEPAVGDHEPAGCFTVIDVRLQFQASSTDDSGVRSGKHDPDGPALVVGNWPAVTLGGDQACESIIGLTTLT